MTEVVLLDGGVGQEIVARAPGAARGGWAVDAMRRQPGLAAEVHAAFFAAGATVATANTYALHRDRLAPRGLEGLFGPLIAQAMAEARAARDARGGGRVAGSIGPLGESYRPDLHPPHRDAVLLYAEMARALVPGADLLIAETIASLAHLRAVAEGAAGQGVPLWLSVTVDDEDGSRLRSGEPVAEAARIASGTGAAAILANCSAPEAMAAALDTLAGAGLPTGAYANAFAQTTKAFLVGRTQAAPRDIGPLPFADVAMGWLDRGAGIVGGCCGAGPGHIAELARRLAEAGHVIV